MNEFSVRDRDVRPLPPRQAWTLLHAAVIGLLVVLASATEGEAQDRAHIRVLAGATFAPAESGALFAAGVSVTVRPWLLLGGEIGRATTMMSRDYQRTIDDLFAQAITFITLDLRVPSVYFTVGPRLVLPAVGGFRPFVDVGIGASRLKLEFDAASFGQDVTAFITDLDGNPLDLSDYRETVLAIAGGGGVAANILGAWGIEVAYRYHRNMTEGADARNVSMASAGVTLGF